MPIFQVLALDPSNRTRCDNALSLLHMIRGLSLLWKSPKISETDVRIEDGNASIEIRDQAAPVQSKDGRGAVSRAYVIALSGDYDRIERLREPLVEFIKEQSFGHLYVIRDEISEDIACKLYPFLYRIENLLRGYLIKFMATRIGPTWWELTASAEMSDKAKVRKKNELVFGRHVDNSAYLIDFDELGELVYEQSSGFLTREDILKRVTDLEESGDAVRNLKEELRTNYQKYFKQSFADRDFKSKWKRWEGLRNKIAHNNLFTNNDLTEGTALAQEIIAIITNADRSMAGLVISQGEREAIQEQVIAKTEATKAESMPLQGEGSIFGPAWKAITEEEFLGELRNQERYYQARPGGFVGLTRFVRFFLGEAGFDYRSSYSMIERLKDAGRMEVYYVENPYDSETRTAALRSLPISGAA